MRHCTTRGSRPRADSSLSTTGIGCNGGGGGDAFATSMHPRWARWWAMLHPVTPPPTITTGARSVRSLPRLPGMGSDSRQTAARFDAN